MLSPHLEDCDTFQSDQKWLNIVISTLSVGEVCNDGPQCLRDGEHGIPDSRDDGQTGRSRLFSGGSHGQGTTCSVVCVQVKLLWNYSRCVFLIFGTGVQLGGRLDLCERGSSGARRSGLYQELSLWALRQGLPHPAHLWGTHTEVFKLWGLDIVLVCARVKPYVFVSFSKNESCLPFSFLPSHS